MKSRMEYHARREGALPIVDRLENELENNVGWLKSKELEVLLRWKGVPVSTMGNALNRCILFITNPAMDWVKLEIATIKFGE